MRLELNDGDTAHYKNDKLLLLLLLKKLEFS